MENLAPTPHPSSPLPAPSAAPSADTELRGSGTQGGGRAFCVFALCGQGEEAVGVG